MSIDLEALAQEFNMTNDDPINSAEEEIDTESLMATEISNPDLVISTNINKANAILDRVISEINRSGMTPRLGEVAGQLIASINQAAGQIYTKDFDMGGLLLKKKLVELKEREVIIKEKMASMSNPGGGTVNQNIIVTDRETVLRLLKENKNEVKMLENRKE